MINQNLVLLKQVLKESGINKDLYSIGEYAENAICVFYNGEQYEVFKCELDNKFDCRRYNSAKDAGFDIVKRLFTKKDRDVYLQKINNLIR